MIPGLSSLTYDVYLLVKGNTFEIMSAFDSALSLWLGLVLFIVAKILLTKRDERARSTIIPTS